MTAGNDIGTLKNGTIVAFEVGFLQLHIVAVLFELLLNPLCALFVGLAVHNAWPKVALGSAESVGRIGIELDVDYGLLSYLALLGGATRVEAHRDTNNIKDISHLLFCVLYCLHDAQEVASPYLLDVFLAESACHQLAGEVGQF